MGTPDTIDTFDPALKDIYRRENVGVLTLKKRVFLGMLKKFSGFGGRQMPLVYLTGNPQGVSANFQTAQSNASEVLLQAMQIKRKSLHSVATIETEVIDATMDDNEAFMEALTTKIDSAWKALADAIETRLYRKSDGVLAQLDTAAGVPSGTTLQLRYTREAQCFERNMLLVASATATGALVAGSARVTKVNRLTGLITVDAAPAAWTDSYFLYVQGNAQNNASTGKTYHGLADWVPASAPSGGESFNGTDRSVDSRMYGSYYDGTAMPLKDSLIDSQSQASELEGDPSDIFLHHVQYRRLAKELEANKEYVSDTARGTDGPIADVSFQGIRLHGDEGQLRCWASNKCQPETGFALQMDEWTYCTLGDAPKFNMGPGKGRSGLIVITNQDALEVRLVARGDLINIAPAHNVQIGLPVVT